VKTIAHLQNRRVWFTSSLGFRSDTQKIKIINPAFLIWGTFQLEDQTAGLAVLLGQCLNIIKLKHLQRQGFKEEFKINKHHICIERNVNNLDLLRGWSFTGNNWTSIVIFKLHFFIICSNIIIVWFSLRQNLH